MGGGGGPKFVGFFGYPPSRAGQSPVAKGACFGPDFGPKQASSDAADAGLGVSADAADAGRIVATLCVRL